MTTVAGSTERVCIIFTHEARLIGRQAGRPCGALIFDER